MTNTITPNNKYDLTLYSIAKSNRLCHNVYQHMFSLNKFTKTITCQMHIIYIVFNFNHCNNETVCNDTVSKLPITILLL